MDKRTLLAIGLCFGIMLAWQKFYIEPTAIHNQNSEQAANQGTQQPLSNAPVSSGAVIQGGNSDLSSSLASPTGKEQREIAVPVGPLKVGSGSRFFADWKLKEYPQTTKTAQTGMFGGLFEKGANVPTSTGEFVDLKSVAMEVGTGELAFDLPEYAYLSAVEGTFEEKGDAVVWTYSDAKAKLTRVFRKTPSQLWVDVSLTAEFTGAKPNFAFVGLSAKGMKGDPEERDRAFTYFTMDSVERSLIEESIALKQVGTPIKWIGLNSRYFLMTLVNASPMEAKALLQPLGPYSGKINLVFAMSGSSISIPLKAYFGPKKLDMLRAVEPTLDHSVDFGWFTIFAYPLLKIMNGFFTLTNNWGVAIILLTLLVKIVTYPLTYKSAKSMREMARIQPQMQKVREKYADDKEAQNREMMSLMKTHGYNPMAGCFPMLIQMPVFFALYRVLYSSIELYRAPFFGWIHDLSMKDPFYVTPIALTITMFVQQKMTPATAADPAQQKMMQIMPLIFGVMMLTLPSGLTIYMLINALTGIVQQMIVNKKLGPATPAVIKVK